MKTDLKINERILSAIIYFILIIFIGYKLNDNFEFMYNSSNNYYVLFVASALMLIMGDYITEPYYTKPVDVIAKTFAILLVLASIPIAQQNEFKYFTFLVYINIFLLLSAIILTLFSSFKGLETIRYLLLLIITKVASPSIIFSILYLLTLFSFFENNSNNFFILFGVWLLLVFRKPVEETSKFIIKLCSIFSNKQINTSIGTAIGCDNPFLYQVEVNNEIHQKYNLKKGQLVYLELENDIGLVGIIFNEKHLLNKKWLNIYMLENEDNLSLKINIRTNKLIENSKTIYSKTNQMYILELDKLDIETKKVIELNYMHKNKNNFIGFVSENSNINKIRFHLLLDISNENHTNIGEGTILLSKIFNNETLFQILDGVTVEEKLEKYDKYGYTTVIAKKIGNYNPFSEELTTVKWLPHIYSPVFLLENKMDVYDYKKFIGKLPNTNYGIPIKNYDELVTHNTAILGILGIGKSRLTFELLKKIKDNTNSKILCIDITNQYENELKEYGFNDNFKYSKYDESIKYIANHYLDISKDRENGGNYNYFKKFVNTSIKEFLCQQKEILIINPNEYNISKQIGDKKAVPLEKDGDKVTKWGEEAQMRDLTVAEITRIISEECLDLCQEMGITDNSRLLLVYEEAHSLIPEWNSTANEGDKSASNGTAKVILQGRKYGLGSFVITQRTANISKSILNQCNTIFAMRVFDDTGKQFLENYIGSDYANTLPTLEERHAIVTGKAMKLKQPIIISLNDMKSVIEDKSQA